MIYVLYQWFSHKDESSFVSLLLEDICQCLETFFIVMAGAEKVEIIGT